MTRGLHCSWHWSSFSPMLMAAYLIVEVHRRSKLHPVRALERQHLARLLRRGGLEPELGDDAADFRHLLGIAGREFSRADIEAVLQPDAHVAAEHVRSEERRVGKECRSRWSPHH